LVEELQGGTFNVSNLGSIGGTHFTPIVTRPQVAVLGVGRSVLKPVFKGEKVTAANLLPLALSYDHRVIDGADGARFIREIVISLENFKEEEFKI
jgi:pyruvate dehydrogenase E2 component (dihydrolipoamide acetyltransferase)